MPLTRPRRFTFDRACDSPGCTFGSMVLIEEVQWGGRLKELAGQILAGTCLNHIHVLLDRLPLLEGEPGDCIACPGSQRSCLHVRDGDWHGTLCRGHAMAYVSHTLAPPAYRRIVDDAGGDPEDVHALHRDFYEPEQGTAHQPYPVGTDSLAEYIAGLEYLPEWDPDEEAWDPVIVKLLSLAGEGYQEKTGLELDEEVARQLVAAALMNEEFRRGGSAS
jgi:hypothetical protein